jgi:hypothetical protein
MQEPRWLIDQFAEARCVSCGARYERASVKILGNTDDYWFVQVVCPACGAQGLGVAIVRSVDPALAEDTVGERPIEMDEVLDAHDLLKRYEGDVHGLFPAPSPRAR